MLVRLGSVTRIKIFIERFAVSAVVDEWLLLFGHLEPRKDSTRYTLADDSKSIECTAELTKEQHLVSESGMNVLLRVPSVTA